MNGGLTKSQETSTPTCLARSSPDMEQTGSHKTVFLSEMSLTLPNLIHSYNIDLFIWIPFLSPQTRPFSVPRDTGETTRQLSSKSS